MKRDLVNGQKTKRTAIILLCFLILYTIILPATVFAAQSSSVTVTLPKFKVTFNGVTVDNANRQYPLIVYNDITYFPMTYYDSRFLGLESNWNQISGLTIEKTNVTAAYRPYSGSAKNGGSYKATVPTFAIKVNGKSVANTDQKYPLLSFRDITYFPLTWDYGVKAFGWDYSFDGKNGLVIQSDNVKMDRLALKWLLPMDMRIT